MAVSMWRSVCGDQWVEVSLWRSMCGSQCREASMGRSVCGSQHMEVSMWRSAYGGQYWEVNVWLSVYGGQRGEGEPIEQEQDKGRMGRGDEREGHSTPSRAQSDKREPDVFDFNTGMMEDDGTATLLRRKPSRISGRWRRRSGSKKWPDRRTEVHSANKENMAPPAYMTEVPAHTEATEPAKPVLLHFSMKDDTDDKVLIFEKERKDGQHAEEEIKAVKMKSLRNYTRAIDRAFRRGWETFVANLNSVTLSPISSSPPSSRSPTEIYCRSSLAEYR